MRFDRNTQAAPARPSCRAVWRRAALGCVLTGALTLGAGVVQAAQPPAEAAHAQAAEGHGQEAEAHEQGALPTIAKIFNFAALAGILVYFLRTPIATYLASRATEIRQDLVIAKDMRAAATQQLAEIDAKMKSLPGELEALRVQGAADVQAERARIAETAAVERARLLEHTRREIEM